jgi:N-acetylglutamate synthase-like GNAT family acetyltransferase
LRDAVSELIVSIQRAEFSIDITAEQQPDLQEIPSFYQVKGGNFWVATEQDCVVGSIALLDIGNGQGALRKMFVARDQRGGEQGTAGCLLETLLRWAGDHDFAEIYLGSTPVMARAHRFYEKKGFLEIQKTELPPAFPVMEVDKKFYRLKGWT